MVNSIETANSVKDYSDEYVVDVLGRTATNVLYPKPSRGVGGDVGSWKEEWPAVHVWMTRQQVVRDDIPKSKKVFVFQRRKT